MYLDSENGKSRIKKRLEVLGASETDELLHYIPFPKSLSLEALPGQLQRMSYPARL